MDPIARFVCLSTDIRWCGKTPKGSNGPRERYIRNKLSWQGSTRNETERSPLIWIDEAFNYMVMFSGQSRQSIASDKLTGRLHGALVQKEQSRLGIVKWPRGDAQTERSIHLDNRTAQQHDRISYLNIMCPEIKLSEWVGEGGMGCCSTGRQWRFSRGARTGRKEGRSCCYYYFIVEHTRTMHGISV